MSLTAGSYHYFTLLFLSLSVTSLVIWGILQTTQTVGLLCAKMKRKEIKQRTVLLFSYNLVPVSEDKSRDAGKLEKEKQTHLQKTMGGVGVNRDIVPASATLDGPHLPTPANLETTVIKMRVRKCLEQKLTVFLKSILKNQVHS